MFGIYGIEGPLFYGRLEDLPAVRPVARSRAVSPIAGDQPTEGAAAANRASLASYQEMLRVERERAPLTAAGEIMQNQIIVVRADDGVVLAWRTLTGHRIHQAPVVNARGDLVGIVGERDLLTALNLENGTVRDPLARRVADVMTSPVVAASPETDIRRIARVMLEQDVDGVPIVDEGAGMIGFISRGDVLRAVVNEPPLSLWR